MEDLVADLSPGEAKFVREYLRNGGNATAAVKRVWGYLSPGSARDKGSTLLAKPDVIKALTGAKIKVLEEGIIDAAWLLERAALLAEFNINRFIKVGDDGQPVYDFRDATDEDWYCITELTVDNIVRGRGDEQYEVERVKLKQDSKKGYLEIIGRHVNVGAFKDESKGTGEIHIHIDGKLADL